jgi:hypothetical protein
MEHRPDELIYKITKNWLQAEAVDRLERELTDDELFTAKKCIEDGINTAIDIVFSTAIQTAVSSNSIRGKNTPH